MNERLRSEKNEVKGATSRQPNEAKSWEEKSRGEKSSKLGKGGKCDDCARRTGGTGAWEEGETVLEGRRLLPQAAAQPRRVSQKACKRESANDSRENLRSRPSLNVERERLAGSNLLLVSDWLGVYSGVRLGRY